MKYIPLPSGHQVIVDDEDYDDLAQFKWHLSNGYPVRHVTTKPDVREYMHRRINKTPDGLVTDHINGNKLDNRKANLRTATISENGRNTGKWRKGANQYAGVTYHKQSGLWRARINMDKKEVSIGYFSTEEEAAQARAMVMPQLYGDFARQT